jgi:hypothetical protein
MKDPCTIALESDKQLMDIHNMKDNIIDRNELQEAYIYQLIDGMDWKTMEQFVYDTLDESLSKYSEAELITEVEDYYPELLEE